MLVATVALASVPWLLLVWRAAGSPAVDWEPRCPDGTGPDAVLDLQLGLPELFQPLLRSVQTPVAEGGYAWGIRPESRTALEAWHRESRNLPVPWHRRAAWSVVAGIGSHRLMELYMRAVCSERGLDTLLLKVPSYGLYGTVAQRLGLRILSWHDAGPAPQAQLLAAAPRALLVVTSPNNPDGELRHRDPLHRALAARAGAVLYDLAYLWPVYADSTLVGAEQLAAELVLGPNDLACFTASKALGLGGARLGYGWLHNATLAALVEEAVFDDSLGISAAGEARYVGLVRHIQDQGVRRFWSELAAVMERRRAALCATAALARYWADRHDGCRGALRTSPYLWLNETQGAALLQAGVVAAPGSRFLPPPPDNEPYARLARHGRVSLMGAHCQLLELVRRLEALGV